MLDRPSRAWTWGSRLAVCMAAWGLGLAVAHPARAQALLPVGSQFQINTYTPGTQAPAVAAANARGDVVIGWTSSTSPGTDLGSESIQARRYSGTSPLGAQFQVNGYTTQFQTSPAAAMGPDGSFVVVWESRRSAGDYLWSIQAQRYASDGSPQAVQFQVNSYATDYQRYPSVASAENGDFVVVWESRGSSGTDSNLESVHGQRYASDGSALGAEFQINSYTTGLQRHAEVAAAPNGDFVVVWRSYGGFGTDVGIFGDDSVQGQRYASDGSAKGGQFQVNSYTTGAQFYPSVAADYQGDFVVVWTSVGSYGTDAYSSFSVQGQRFSQDGSPRGGEFQVNTYTTMNQTYPAVAASPAGNFVVVWQSWGSSGTDSFFYSIQGQHFGADGSPQGGEFQVNTYTSHDQGMPAAISLPGNDFLVVWHSNRAGPGNDTDSLSIQGQRYRVHYRVPALSKPLSLGLAGTLLVLGIAAVRRRRRYAQ
ncbi:MAG TPA: hypothetical protein VII72_05250 [Myxococcota bacterium]